MRAGGDDHAVGLQRQHVVAAGHRPGFDFRAGIAQLPRHPAITCSILVAARQPGFPAQLAADLRRRAEQASPDVRARRRCARPAVRRGRRRPPPRRASRSARAGRQPDSALLPELRIVRSRRAACRRESRPRRNCRSSTAGSHRRGRRAPCSASRHRRPARASSPTRSPAPSAIAASASAGVAMRPIAITGYAGRGRPDSSVDVEEMPAPEMHVRHVVLQAVG